MRSLAGCRFCDSHTSCSKMLKHKTNSIRKMLSCYVTQPPPINTVLSRCHLLFATTRSASPSLRGTSAMRARPSFFLAAEPPEPPFFFLPRFCRACPLV